MSVSDCVDTGAPPAMHFRILGPDGGGPSAYELRRLFPGQRMSATRRIRLEQSGRIVALCGPKVVGLAVFERADRELRVNEVGVDPGSPCGIDAVSDGLLEALELACQASGARRLLLLPRAEFSALVLGRRGYVAIADGGAAGSWFEKRFG